MNWTQLSKPIIGLAPMDGITDAAFREIVDIYGKPDVLFTEFVPAEGIAHGAMRLFRSLQRHQTRTPIVGQLFGSTPLAFYKAAIILAALGFDGVDINMGCPDRNIAKKGGGAGLIRQPELAKELILTVKKALLDWLNGITLETAHIHQDVIDYIYASGIKSSRKVLPTSVKTRTGIEEPITEEWINTLLEVSPDAITLHGRTLTQLYRGNADWEQIALGVNLAKGTSTVFLGNGDVDSVSQAREYVKIYGVQGVLMGRSALGNPWFFGAHSPRQSERFDAMIEHCRLFIKYRSELKLFPMRKHLAWYVQKFDGAAKMRDALMHIETVEDVEKVIASFRPPKLDK